MEIAQRKTESDHAMTATEKMTNVTMNHHGRQTAFSGPGKARRAPSGHSADTALAAVTRRRLRKARSHSSAGTKRKRWSRRVTETSNALDLEKGVFSQRSPRAIALSLKRSAERSGRRKSDPFRSAMSMLTFYVNRAGKRLPKTDRERLQRAKDELRRVYHRPTHVSGSSRS
jgi:hypothetical protein